MNPVSDEDVEIPMPEQLVNKEFKVESFDTVKNDSVEKDKDKDDGEEKLFSFFTGMKNDLMIRKPFYNFKGDGVGDWGKPDNFMTVFNATIFAFVIQLIPALIFAELMDRQTDGHLATAETLLSSAIIGIIYAIFSGQPLTIMGITGPVSLLLGTSYGLAEQFNASYFPFFFWICVWAGLMHVISAVIGLVSLVWKVSPFTTQIFELFIAITFIYSALRDLIVPIHLIDNVDVLNDAEEDITTAARSAGYASFIIGLITCYVAWSLHFAETSIFFSRQVRTFLTSYNTLIAVVIATALSYIPGIDQDNLIERVDVVAPWNWEPTYDRPWITNPLDGIGLQGIFGALIPGFMFFLLFIIDHNVSSIMTQSPKFNLKKPPAYHWDFFVLGITFFPCAILGLPPGNGLIPQAPLHCRALCTRKMETDKYGVTREVVTHCEEQRWSALGQAVLMFVALSAFSVIAWIPTGCLFGLLLYLGMSALHGNEIWERLLLFGVYEHKRPRIPIVRYVRWNIVQLWTVIQLACALAIWAVGQFASFGYIYPLLLSLLVPFRSFVLDYFFKPEDTKHLDPADESEEDFHDEQRMIHHAIAQGTKDEEEMAFTTRAEFRGQGMKRALMNANRRHTIGGNGENDDILAVEVAKACIDLDLDDATKLEIVQRASKKILAGSIGAQTDPDHRIKASKSITDLMALNNLGNNK